MESERKERKGLCMELPTGACNPLEGFAEILSYFADSRG